MDGGFRKRCNKVVRVECLSFANQTFARGQESACIGIDVVLLPDGFVIYVSQRAV